MPLAIASPSDRSLGRPRPEPDAPIVAESVASALPPPAAGLRPIMRGAALGCWAPPRFEATMLGIIALLFAAEIATILIWLGGHFSYTLDDAYIHLALADRIAAGHYGLNPAEPAAPASSIGFPFLLAGLSGLGLGQALPLVVNIAATSASGLLLCAVARRSMPLESLPPGMMALACLTIVLALGLVGVALTGLEHALHVAVTLACGYGALRFLQTGRIANWWWLCALAEPAIRYEGASLWLGIVVMLVAHRRWRAGGALFFCGLAVLIGFSWFLLGLGLPPLPSSVLVKSGAAAAGAAFSPAGLLQELGDSLGENLMSAGGLRLLALSALMPLATLAPWGGDAGRRRIVLELAALAGFVGLAHCLLGRIGPFARYELYAVALDVLVLLFGFGPWLAAAAPDLSRVRAILVALVPLAFASHYVHATVLAPIAARQICLEQYEMHRLAVEFYRAPVAVNDLGWVGYRNPFYVLDLWGLGSEPARRARLSDPSGRWMADLTAAHDVGLAMIYEGWFPRKPKDWRALARLTFDGPARFTDRVVTLYATGPERVGPIEAALREFTRALPPDVHVEPVPAAP